jgi:predicted metal-dependent hydrolase
MLDLFRWHGAEEVEHRAVVFDVYQHISGNYLLKQFVMVALASPLFLRMWVEGAKFLMENDPALPREKWSQARVIREWRRASKKGLSPGIGDVFGAGPHFLRPGYHPIKEGSTEEALAYLKISPGAQGAYRAS